MILLADAHVHIHDVFVIPSFLTAAYSHFSKEAERHSRKASFTGFLLLSESNGQNWFGRFRSRGIPEQEEESNGGDAIWRVRETPEMGSLIIENGQGHRLFVLAGRQIVTRERIEILALATSARFRDGMSIVETYDSIENAGAIPVLPWGFGKWLGRRGAIVARFLERSCDGIVFLGDNGGRPRLIPFPRRFCLGRPDLLVRVLPGSDPLPFSWESNKAGGFGFSVCGTVNPECPASDLKAILRAPETVLQPYGSPESLPRFVRNQIGIQMWNRTKGMK